MLFLEIKCLFITIEYISFSCVKKLDFCKGWVIIFVNKLCLILKVI